MSAMGWLEFIGALILGAVVWALVQQPTRDLHQQANNTTTTSMGQSGVDYLGIWIDWLALWVIGLAVFGFIVTVVVRRESVFR